MENIVDSHSGLESNEKKSKIATITAEFVAKIKSHLPSKKEPKKGTVASVFLSGEREELDKIAQNVIDSAPDGKGTVASVFLSDEEITKNESAQVAIDSQGKNQNEIAQEIIDSKRS